MRFPLRSFDPFRQFTATDGAEDASTRYRIFGNLWDQLLLAYNADDDFVKHAKNSHGQLMTFSRIRSNPREELPDARPIDRAVDDAGYLWFLTRERLADRPAASRSTRQAG